jgi:SAM-dependent methyltransferase
MTAEVRHPLFARWYACLSRRAETADVVGYRRELLAGLAGRVIELGAGNGLNFAYYPPEVSEVVAVEPESYLRGRALEAARAAAVTVRVVDAVADRLPFPDADFDAAIVSLVLCSVPDPTRALGELRRVLRPGAELRFWEHVRPGNPRRAARWQQLDDWNIYPRLAGGCHAARDTETAIGDAGFALERIRRFEIRGGPVRVPHILGVGRRV